MMWAKNKNRGFTIVELLIVIVVIAILAAITIVSYNNITGQAKNTRVIAVADAWTKTLLLYKASVGNFPGNQGQNYCVGTTYEETAIFPENKCVLYSSPSITDWDMGFTYDTSLIELLKNTVSSPPKDTMEPKTMTLDTTTIKARGLLYGIPTSGPPTLRYHIKSTDKCARGEKISSGIEGFSICLITLN